MRNPNKNKGLSDPEESGVYLVTLVSGKFKIEIPMHYTPEGRWVDNLFTPVFTFPSHVRAIVQGEDLIHLEDYRQLPTESKRPEAMQRKVKEHRETYRYA